MLILHTYIQAFTINILRQSEVISTIPISFFNPFGFMPMFMQFFYHCILLEDVRGLKKQKQKNKAYI